MDLTSRITAFAARTPEERRTKKQVLSSLEKHGKTLLCRESTAIHFTASALLLNPAMDRVLMVHHTIFNTFTWTGGHADGEEDLLSVAVRKAKEETGAKFVYPVSGAILSLDLLEVPAHSKKGAAVAAHRHYSAAYGMIVPEKQPLICKPDENSAVCWISVDALSGFCTEAHMLPIYKKVYTRMKELQARKEKLYKEIPVALLPWYQKNARDLPWRRDRKPYHVWLSEIMLQQTRVEAVKGYYNRFLQTFPTIEALAKAKEDLLFKCWEGLGYYNRARNLQKAAKKIMLEDGGQFPSDYDAIASLPGIGAYTAGAIASICFEQPKAAVDGNVLRVISRITEQFACVDQPQVKKAVAQALEQIYPAGQCGNFTQSLMELGATVCLPGANPKCTRCPAGAFCMAYQNKTQPLLPVKRQKRMRKTEEKTVFLLCCGTSIAVSRREEKGLLSGLWQLPNIQGVLSEKQAVRTAEAWGIGDSILERVLHRKHVFTHVEWNMTCYCLQCTEKAPCFTWVTKKQMEGGYALPTAFRIFLPPQDK